MAEEELEHLRVILRNVHQPKQTVLEKIRDTVNARLAPKPVRTWLALYKTEKQKKKAA